MKKVFAIKNILNFYSLCKILDLLNHICFQIFLIEWTVQGQSRTVMKGQKGKLKFNNKFRKLCEGVNL